MPIPSNGKCHSDSRRLTFKDPPCHKNITVLDRMWDRCHACKLNILMKENIGLGASAVPCRLTVYTGNYSLQKRESSSERR